MTVTICWFRRDLRLADHRALSWAAGEGEVVALFVDDPVFDRAGAPRRAFLAASLAELDRSMDGALVVRRGDPRTVVAAVAAECAARVVVASEDFGPYGTRRDAAVAARLAADGVELRLLDRPYAVAPGSVRKDDDTPYSVFTPFSRVWQRIGWETPLGAAQVQWRRLASDGLPSAPTTDSRLPPAGEAAAHERWERFADEELDRYAEQRNQPGIEGTSGLSPYLRWGALHPRQLLARLGDVDGHRVFRSELAWRDFYADVLFRRPETAWRNLQPKMDAMQLDTDERARQRFAAWQAGRTGYPIVDAGMRQLLATGWMHNRVRMIVASFLVKDLHLPWQWGARHFMDHLVDGDLASNSHGWQWTAGTGTDAAPYFRIFNPVTQAAQYDPDGRYLRAWLPELAQVGGKELFAPWTSKRGLPLGVEPPLVDHAKERDEALRRYSSVSGQ